ncbi:43 kDa receptor-associated protein of the synapse [Aplysia californica]|uniref:43 kDa receptor-associated protein of the synapse n=1 Tax=Aplysia californica TaxID=6500 RepID=A0ABM1VTB2_APLCA|nr:43 kDa receptor-associated protein of the synapse [Aplysia californica]
MGQKMAKKEMEKAQGLYNEQRFDEATQAWLRALKHLAQPVEKFKVCGKICTSLCDVGKYRDALTYAGQQCEIANGLSDVMLKSEAYYNIAVCNEKSCEFSKAISYCRNAQQCGTDKSPLKGRLSLCLGNAFLGSSDFLKAWNNYVVAMDKAKAADDRLLELLTSARMGTLFCCVGDLAAVMLVSRLLPLFPQAMELNEKALELATRVGCKLEMLRCHARLKLLCEARGEDDEEERSLCLRHEGVMRQLVLEMDLYCGVCDQVIGQSPERLEPLSCGHFIHARCAIHLARSTLGRSSKRRPCPACRRNMALNPAFQETS